MVFSMIWESTLETLYMVFFSTLFSFLIGFPVGILLVITKEGGILERPKLNKILEFVINTLRSFPFIILMILVFPLSRLIVGTTIGSTAAIVPLSISAAPFVARMVEGALNEVDKGLIEASSSMGADNFTIVFKVMIPETMPHIIHGLTVTVISLIGFSAMAGTIGAGGLGDLAIRFGYQRFKTDIMVYSVIVIIIVVQVIQTLGNYLVARSKKNR
ncbi:Methionine import system permease protein MetP [Fusobacterium sp. DD29]|uniref:methionine ABC transporter permease n=1 Tax=unclassified Fusobacterium TaxID=2648384 RepID=UPI001B8ACBD7|nr:MULTISPECIES: methionine ABC transporter permease [unclassified Fusobacterium]MBR8700623.1 Methionine import system permease protein MetP [Fusobacterium sp. DD45]MBR8710159.1 Methionine import system permease protein MetP [Fusobacterium sp. DD28]MBR8750268.1 Methionine import system permease protein MetP [Fusobacterium sp. DD29]MBR8750848.1 Methionine import system permease protein MetP [Fusobacterium sp. DD26]MBR8762509.1 Methionine import system permease protein MetP [Fusobacterium sp. DD